MFNVYLPVERFEDLAPEELCADILEDYGPGGQLGQVASHLLPVPTK